LLSEPEVVAVEHRLRRLLSTSKHPLPSEDWPAIPWPPF
jgi:hypothetical protein